jgi:uncharacterized protein (DUF2141 family)
MNKFILIFFAISSFGLVGGITWMQSVLSYQEAETDTAVGPSIDVAFDKTNAASTEPDSAAAVVQSFDDTEESVALVSSSGSSRPIAVKSLPDKPISQQFLVKGLKVKESNIYVAVFESEAGFPKAELSNKTIVVPASQDRISFSLELPCGQPLAIAVFQDIDGNGVLSKNQFGIPAEPYGFSNNARSNFGPPSFSQAAFVVNQTGDDAETIEISLR